MPVISDSNASPQPKGGLLPETAMSMTSCENSSQPRHSDALRVAVADDDRSARELLVHMLRKQGHVVVAIAGSGQALVESCAETVPDVIITGDLMPDLGGADAAAVIYAQRPLPIILISGYCDRNLVLEAEQKHVSIYLVKPISDDNLRAALERCRALSRALLARDGPAAELPWQSRFEETPGRSPRTAPCTQAARPLEYTRRGS
jgi:CheY-like chemotaxis protein